MFVERKQRQMAVRTRLKDIMREKNVTRMELVRKLELTYPTVMKWENDKLDKLDVVILMSLMKYLGVSYEELIYEVDDEGVS